MSERRSRHDRRRLDEDPTQRAQTRRREREATQLRAELAELDGLVHPAELRALIRGPHLRRQRSRKHPTR